jgi:aspartyl/asparaginyl beta-hydroxylase (cupin superfamily)
MALEQQKGRQHLVKQQGGWALRTQEKTLMTAASTIRRT